MIFSAKKGGIRYYSPQVLEQLNEKLMASNFCEYSKIEFIKGKGITVGLIEIDKDTFELEDLCELGYEKELTRHNLLELLITYEELYIKNVIGRSVVYATQLDLEDVVNTEILESAKLLPPVTRPKLVYQGEEYSGWPAILSLVTDGNYNLLGKEDRSNIAKDIKNYYKPKLDELKANSIGKKFESGSSLEDIPVIDFKYLNFMDVSKISTYGKDSILVKYEYEGNIYQLKGLTCMLMKIDNMNLRDFNNLMKKFDVKYNPTSLTQYFKVDGSYKNKVYNLRGIKPEPKKKPEKKKKVIVY